MFVDRKDPIGAVCDIADTRDNRRWKCVPVTTDNSDDVIGERW